MLPGTADDQATRRGEGWNGVVERDTGRNEEDKAAFEEVQEGYLLWIRG